MPTLSCVIITLNEEKNIGRAIRSAKAVVDEVIVADTGSIDNTINVSEEYGAKVFHLKFSGYGTTKNEANKLASNDFILWLDADEELNEEAIHAINKWREEHKIPNQAAKLNRLNNIEGQWIKHGDWYPDTKIRVFHRDFFRWSSCAVHEKLVAKEKTSVEQLDGNILHYAYKNLDELVTKTKLYASLASSDINKKRKNLIETLASCAWRFIKGYVLKKGFLDGRLGFAIALINTRSVWWKNRPSQ